MVTWKIGVTASASEIIESFTLYTVCDSGYVAILIQWFWEEMATVYGVQTQSAAWF